MASKGISVVIPNYNGEKLLPEILPALYFALQKSKLPYEVIISDDCSTDNSITYLNKHHPDIQLITNNSNRGFSPTINEGIRKSKYSWILLLNSDVKLEENYFLPLLRYMKLEDCFGVMGRIVGWDDDKIQDGGKYPSSHAFKIKTNRNYIPSNPEELEYWPSMYLSGANAFVNKEKIMTLEGFDELFAPFYVEDFELSMRAWRLGWKCYYEHKAICRHQTSVTIKNSRKKKHIKTIYNRNKFFLHAIHLQGFTYLMWWLQLIAELFFRCLAGQFHFAKSFYLFLRQRNNVNSSRNKLKILASNHHKKLQSIQQVGSFIADQLKGRTIELF